MPDRLPASALIHTVKFRLGDNDHARLARQAEALRLRVNELARQLVIGKARSPAAPPALDPGIVVRLQDIGLRLRGSLSRGACDPELGERIADLCFRIEQLVDLAISGEDA